MKNKTKMSLIKLLWCKIVGHIPSEGEYSKECDGSMEFYVYCKRCGIKVNHTTFYDFEDYPPTPPTPSEPIDRSSIKFPRVKKLSGPIADVLPSVKPKQ